MNFKAALMRAKLGLYVEAMSHSGRAFLAGSWEDIREVSATDIEDFEAQPVRNPFLCRVRNPMLRNSVL